MFLELDLVHFGEMFDYLLHLTSHFSIALFESDVVQIEFNINPIKYLLFIIFKNLSFQHESLKI